MDAFPKDAFPKEDLYQLLGVSPDAEMADIKHAYNQLALKYHPDKNQGSREAAERFKKIKFAYEVLGSYKSRREYDSYRSGSGRVMGRGLLVPFFFGIPNLFDATDIEELFSRDVPFDRSPDGRKAKSAVYVQTSSYERGPDGKVKTSQRVKTNLNGQTKEYSHRSLRDREGRILEQEGSPPPYRDIERDLEHWWRRSSRKIEDLRQPKELQHRKVSENSIPRLEYNQRPVQKGGNTRHKPVQDPFKYAKRHRVGGH